MNIIYTFDDGYAEITGVSLISLFENNLDIEKINIYVIDFGILDISKQKLINIVSKYKRSIYFIKAIDLKKRIPIETINYGWSPVCYIRLFYAEMLPDNLDRVIHIDCDTIITSSLKAVFEYDLNDFFCAACYDCTPRPKRQANLEKTIKYISNGLILIDLEKWRNNHIGDQFVDFILKKNGKLPHLDQDVLNAVLKNKIAILPAEFNIMPVTFMYKTINCDLFLGEPYYSKEEIEKALEHPVMIHFTGSRYTRRPWQQPCMHKYNDEWIKYYKKADYSVNENLLKQDKRAIVILKCIYAKLWIAACKFMPLRKARFYMDRKFLWKL